MIDFGGRIKAVRLKLGMTQQDFSEKLGVKQSFYSLVESNKAFLPLTKSEILFSDFGVSPQWFFSAEELDSVILEKPVASTPINPIDGVDAFHKLIDMFYKSQEQVKKLSDVLAEKDIIIKQKDEEISKLINRILNCENYKKA